jgi:1-hydroxycarotenoid 3,4-desaturase
MVAKRRVVIVGAGAGGLAAALELAAAGLEVTVLERAATPGGKIRTLALGDVAVDAGPTVFTMRWVFDELFRAAGLVFDDFVQLDQPSVLARHAWVGGAQLDLFASVAQSADAIGAFAGAAEARRYIAFAERSRAIYETLEGPFIRRSCASPQALMRAVGWRRFGELWRITPFASLWRSLGRQFADPRLRQLFARYATYCGSSPFAAPATLMLIAHVERDGVWIIREGMHRLAQALMQAGVARGAKFRFNTEVAQVSTHAGKVTGVTLLDGETIPADAVILNADCAAVAAGLFGAAAAHAAPAAAGVERSLSAITWAYVARSQGMPLQHHNVFFCSDYRREFGDIFKRSQMPQEPTVYVCAQDRRDTASVTPGMLERLLCLINAPPDGDRHCYTPAEIQACETRSLSVLERCGVILDRSPAQSAVATPNDFHRLFPGTGGALYGPASHGFMASFKRSGARTRLPGLYLAGGSAHPGAGVPMAAISGRLAAASVIQDWHSIGASSRTVIAGGMSTESATMRATELP